MIELGVFVNMCQRPTHESEEISIVLVGDFNPAIFQPSWFALEKLVRPSEAEHAHIEIIHPDIAGFSMDWVTIHVTRERFLTATRSLAYGTHLQDLVVGTINKLRHTPVRQLGINLTYCLRFSSEDEWHNFGHFLAPKTPWENLLKHPGMRSIQMQGARSDGYFLVTVAPLVGNVVSIQVNDHREIPRQDGVSPK